jgi:hypothetical protein
MTSDPFSSLFFPFLASSPIQFAMRRVVKVKALATGAPLRKAATTSSAASRRNFPAWISADDSGVAFTAKGVGVTPRVRDALVLRLVGKRKPVSAKSSSHGPGAR